MSIRIIPVHDVDVRKGRSMAEKKTRQAVAKKQGSAKNTGSNKPSFVNSISFKIMGLTVGALAIAVVLVLVISIGRFRTFLTGQISNQILYMAQAERYLVDLETGGVSATVSQYGGVLDEVSLEGY